MKQITMDWDTYILEQRKWEKIAYNSALGEIGPWLETGQPWAMFFENGYPGGSTMSWRRFLENLGRETSELNEGELNDD